MLGLGVYVNCFASLISRLNLTHRTCHGIFGGNHHSLVLILVGKKILRLLALSEKSKISLKNKPRKLISFPIIPSIVTSYNL